MEDSTALVVSRANSGERLPAGDLYVMPFNLPNGGNLRGAAGAQRTTIHPLTDAAGPLITVASPGRSSISELEIVGSGPTFQQTGLVLNTSGSLFTDIAIRGFTNGVLLQFSVDNTFRNCDLRGNACNVCGTGNGLPELSVTTTRFLQCGIRDATWCGAYLAHGWGYDFTGSIVESNGQIGIQLVATPLSSHKSIDPVCLTNVWFEDNGTGGPAHLLATDNGVAVDPALFTTQSGVRKAYAGIVSL